MNRIDFLLYLRELYNTTEYPFFKMAIMVLGNSLSMVTCSTKTEELAMVSIAGEGLRKMLQAIPQETYSYDYFEEDGVVDAEFYLVKLRETLVTAPYMGDRVVQVDSMNENLAHNALRGELLEQAWQLRLLQSRETRKLVCRLI